MLNESGKNAFYYMGFFHSRKAEVKALVFDGETFVIDAEVVEEGGVEIADVDGILDDVVGVVIRFSIVAGFETSTDYAGGEATAMVVATMVILSQFALTVDSAAKFSTKDDHGVLKHAAFFKILD